jgi:hypothetical protein
VFMKFVAGSLLYRSSLSLISGKVMRSAQLLFE